MIHELRAFHCVPPDLVREHLEPSMALVSVPPTLLMRTSSPPPFLLNPIDYHLRAGWCREIRLYKETGRLTVR
jgi:hypothetical protein